MSFQTNMTYFLLWNIEISEDLEYSSPVLWAIFMILLWFFLLLWSPCLHLLTIYGKEWLIFYIIIVTAYS